MILAMRPLSPRFAVAHVSAIAFLITSIPITVGCSHPRGTYQTARVSMVDGNPCFGVPDTREARATPTKLVGIVVYSRESGKAEPIWKRSFTDGSQSIGADDCIAYGDTGSTETEEPPQLLTGTHYSVDINGYLEPEGENRRQSRQHRAYMADFCIVEEMGEVVIRSIERDGQGIPDWTVCAGR